MHHQGAEARETSTSGLLHNGDRLGLDRNLKYQASLLPTLPCIPGSCQGSQLQLASNEISSWKDSWLENWPVPLLSFFDTLRFLGAWRMGNKEGEAESAPAVFLLLKALVPTLYLPQVYIVGIPKNIAFPNLG